jgi:hypothetical protein
MRYLLCLFLFFSYNLLAQVDSCEAGRLKWDITSGTGEPIRLKWDITSGTGEPIQPYYRLPDTGKTIPVHHFLDTRKMVPETKMQLWVNTKVFNFKGYQVNNLKLAAWSGVAFAGVLDGVLEGNRFDGNRNFERKYNVSKISYFGSESWKLAYKNEDPGQGGKNILAKVYGAQDFYHHADDFRKLGYIFGGITLGISGTQTNSKVWHYAADFIIGFAISGISKAAGMYWIRN